ncbi:MAG TPA: MlaD family protein [Streptosporangiaceae bacterium]|nr:MlaD family protein [Streptosporangiaceae bacterium]
MRAFFLRIFGGPVVHGHRTLSAWKLGLGFLVGVLIIGWAVFNKAQITTWLTPGETVKVNFASDYRLRPYFSQVKIAYVPVGMVTGVEQADDGSAVIDVKLYGSNRDRLGSMPSATIRPTTILGGNYFLDLEPGGDPGRFKDEMIPKDRAHLPVELDKVAKALQPDALIGMKGTITKFDETLQGGGTAALQRLAADAPSSLGPTGQVLDALRGTDPDHDLTNVVHGFEATARELAEPKGRLDSILNDLASTSAVFGNRSQDFSTTLDELPGALHSADRGLHRLNTTLDVLHDTAKDIRPEAQELDSTLKKLNPVLERARPVVHHLRNVLEDARPLLENLVDNTSDLQDVLDDLHGPVLNRVNGPISDLILGSYHGHGPYAQTVTDKPVFEELGYAVADLDRATMMSKNGSGIAFEPQPIPEPGENVLQNNGQPRSETLERSVTDPLRINPPIQSPGQAPHASPGHPQLLPMMGSSSDGEGK